MDERFRAPIVGLIFTKPDGERDHVLNVEDVTTGEDLYYDQVRYRGFCPDLKQDVHVILSSVRNK